MCNNAFNFQLHTTGTPFPLLPALRQHVSVAFSIDQPRSWALSYKYINLLNPTGHVMHHQFNIQQLYVLPTLYLCVLYLPEIKKPLLPLTA